jgi:hypothetical protein
VGGGGVFVGGGGGGGGGGGSWTERVSIILWTTYPKHFSSQNLSWIIISSIAPWEFTYPCTYHPLHILELFVLILSVILIFYLLQYEQRTDLILHTSKLIFTGQSYDFFLSQPYSTKGVAVGEILRWPCLPSIYLQGVGWGGVAGWVLPCPSSMLTCGRGAGDSPYKRQSYTVLILGPKLNVPRFFITNLSPYPTLTVNWPLVDASCPHPPIWVLLR